MNRKIFKITEVLIALFVLTVFFTSFARNKIFNNISVRNNISVPHIEISENITVYGDLVITGPITTSNFTRTQGQTTANALVLFADTTGKVLKNSAVLVDNAGNIAINGITKNGNTVSWPSNVGPLGTVLTSDGAGNLYYAIASGGGNVAASPLFANNNRIVVTDTPSGIANIKQSGVTLNGADITGLNTLTANNVSVTGNLTGNASSATLATVFTNNFSTNVFGPYNDTVVNSVGGQSAINIESAIDTIATATSNNTINAVVKRDINGNFAANVITANLIGTVTGDLSGQATSALSTGTAVNFTQPMFGDVTQARLTAVVSMVGGKTAAQVAQAAIDVSNASYSSSANFIVKRDGSNNFAANVITANLLTGNVTGNLSGQANSAISATHTQDFLGSLTGDVSGTQGATQVDFVGGKSSSDVALATTNMLTATSNNIANTVLKRDINGNFVASKITSDLLGNVTGNLYVGNATNAITALSAISVLTATDFLGSLTGDVIGTQGATVVSKVNGKTASEVANAIDMVASATSENIPNTLVKRDVSGNFVTNKISITGPIANSTDVTTKAYVDNAALGVILPKQAALAVSTTNFAPLSGLQTIDGVALLAGNRALLVGQNNGVNNGLWLVQPSSWVRPDDFASTSTVGRAYILTTSGLTEAGSAWLCSTPLSVIDTNTISFDRFSDPGQVTAENVGLGDGKIFAGKTGIIINLKSIAAVAGKHMLITNNTSDIQIATDATSDNTANTIISRDALGSFSATLIGRATSNVLKSGDTMFGDIVFAPNAGVRSAVNLYNTPDANFVGLRAPNSLVSTYTIDLPGVQPIAGQYLQAASSFVTTWTNISSSPAIARAFYVSLSGLDSNNGSLSSPFRHIAYAIGQANLISSLTNPVVIFVGAGIFDEDNSGSAISISADGISIVGSSMSSTIVRPTSTSNDLFQTVVSNLAIANIALQGAGSQYNVASVKLNSNGYGKIQFDSIAVSSFGTGFDLHRNAGDYPVVLLQNIQASGNNIAVDVNEIEVFIKGSVFRGPLGGSVAANTAVAITGLGAFAEIFDSNFLSFDIGVYVTGGAYLDILNCSIASSNNGVICSGSSKTNIIGSNFVSTATNSLSFQADGSQTVAYIEGVMFDYKAGLITTGTAIRISDSAFVSACNSAIDGAYAAIECGLNSSEPAATTITANSLNLLNCTADIIQRGASTLKFIGGTIEVPGLSIENPANVNLASFNSNARTTLAFGNTFDRVQPVFKIINGQTTAPAHGQAIPPALEYWPNFYGSKGMLCTNLNVASSPSCSGIYTEGENASYYVVTGNRDSEAAINLRSDESTNVGDGHNVRGWAISKTGTQADLTFTYTNNDTTGQLAAGPNVIMRLDGVNNNINFPAATNYPYTTPKLLWAPSIDTYTNLYRNSAGVLRTDGNFVVGGLTANTVVVSDSSKKLVSSAVTDTQLGYLSGVTSPVQAQINSKVSKSGDTMTGALTLPAGQVINPSLQFTGSTNTGVTAQVLNELSLVTNGSERMQMVANGNVYITNLNTQGVVHSIVPVPGSLDATFNSAGSPAGTLITTVTGQTGNAYCNSVAMQADGKIVVAGQAYIGGYSRFALARYGGVNGALDGTFGVDGTLMTTITGQTATDNSAGNSMAIQADGKIVVAGIAFFGGYGRFALARYDGATGALDGSFGVDGTLTTTITGQTATDNSSVNSVAIQADGKIVVAGYAYIGGNSRFALARYDGVTGALVGTFGTDGTLTTTITGQTATGDSIGRSMAIQADGKIVVAGYAKIGGYSRFALARFDGVTGELDGTFGTDGTLTTTITGQTATENSYCRSMAIQADGKIVLAGIAYIGGNPRFALARFDGTTGALDTTFGIGGTVTTTITGQSGILVSNCNSVAIQANGKIVVAGSAYFGGNNRFALARFGTNGILDATFNPLGSPAGTLATTITGQTSASEGSSMAIQTDGKIVAAGYVKSGSYTYFALARFYGASPGKISSSLVIDADIIANAGIPDSKLGLIQTVGKVANSATSAASINNLGAIVARDALGTFTATTIYANLVGSAATATNLSVSFAGDVIGTQTSTVVSYIGSHLKTSTSVAVAMDMVNSATSNNVAGTIVNRDSSGNFAANMITILGAITSANQASNKGYVDSAVSQMHTGTLLLSGANTITQDGLYTLTSNITANIIINSDDVTIDLSDFMIYSTGPSAVIEVGSGYKNIQIKNGKIKGDTTNNGVLVDAGCQLINLSNLKFYYCTNGLNCNGTSGSKIIRGKVQDCSFDSCSSGVSLNYTQKMVFRNCETYKCIYSGFDQYYSNYNIFDNCLAFETINNDPVYDAKGFSSFAGTGNLFSGCLAEGTTKSAGNYTDYSTRAIGFLLTGAQNSMENDTKIINSISNTTLVQTTSCTAYGVLLDPVLKSGTFGSLLVASTSAPASVRSSKWSPDGKYLVVISNVTSANNVGVYKLVGSALNLIASVNPAPTTPYFADWSPNGKYLAVVCQANANPNLIVYSFNGSTLASVISYSHGTTYGVNDLFGVAWSPDGKYLAAVGQIGTEVGAPNIIILTFNPSTPALNLAGSIALTGRGTIVSWSPCGKYLAVSFGVDTSAPVKILKFDGSVINYIATSNYYPANNLYAVSWSPSGKYLVIGGDTVSGEDKAIVFKFDPTLAAGSILTYVSQYTHDTSGYIFFADWSPSGRYIVISGGLGSGTNQVQVLDFLNGTLIPVTEKNYTFGEDVWTVSVSPTGKYLSMSGASGAVKVYNFMDAPYNCLLQENKVCNATSYLSAGGGFSRQAIGICGSGDNLYLKNVGFASDVNFNKAVYNVYGQSLLSSIPRTSDNLWQPPFENAYGYSYQ